MANGGIIGTVNTPTSTTATGVWQQEEQYEAVRDGTWPSRPLFTTKSLRFNDGSSDYLNKTHSSSGGTTKATYSGWIKKCTLSNQKILFMEYESSGNYMMITFETANTIRIYGENGGSELFYLKTNAVYRDPSAWMHIVVAFDSTQGTSTNRNKIIYKWCSRNKSFINNISKSRCKFKI